MRKLPFSVLLGAFLQIWGANLVLASDDKPVCKRLSDLPDNTVVELCKVKQATVPMFKLAISGCDGALSVSRLPKTNQFVASIICQGEVVGLVAVSDGGLMYADDVVVKPKDGFQDGDIPQDARMKAVFKGTFVNIAPPPLPNR